MEDQIDQIKNVQQEIILKKYDKREFREFVNNSALS